MVPKELYQMKTQVSLELLEQGMARLQNNLKSINDDYLGDVELRTLLTTIVENPHAVFTSKTRLSQLYSMLETLAQLQKNHQKERQSGAPNTLHMTNRFIQFHHLVWSGQMLK